MTAEFVSPFRVEFADPVTVAAADAGAVAAADAGAVAAADAGAVAAAEGGLSGLSVAVKDVIDVAGVKTGAGNPAFLEAARPAGQHSAPVALLLAAGASAVGKAHTDEFAYSLSGTNVHYGTPLNAAAAGRVPGGSSSGPASAVCSGLVDIGLGTDTAGSIRVPASYCGLYGLRPTHGRVPVAGMLPLAPTFDTVGLVTGSGELLERAALVLLGPEPSPADPPEALVLGSDLFAEADPAVRAALATAAERLAGALGVSLSSADVAGGRLPAWLDAFVRRQRVEAWRELGPWIELHRPSLGPGIAARFDAARTAPESDAILADSAHVEVLAALDRVLPSGDALVLPTTATVAPPPALASGDKDDLRARTMRLTTIAGLGGAPAVSLPLAAVDGLPVGLSLLGRPGDDERLLAAARRACAAA